MTDITTRKGWMSLLAQSPAAELQDLWTDLGRQTDHTLLRQPEIGGVMVQGRAGGTGDAFNLGEMTVTRCSLRLADATIGHGYVQGRNKVHATQAAQCDALMQTDAADAVMEKILRPLAKSRRARQAATAAQAAKTKVDFFTMVRGE